jgi:glycerol-3-phosphate dehydrogenase
VVEREGREAPCQTAEIPLGMPASDADLDDGLGLDDAVLRQLAFRYGHRAARVLAIARQDPELAVPILPGMPDLMAEVRLAAAEEQALSVADVLLRRTRLGLIAAPDLRDREVIRKVALCLGSVHGWGKQRVDAEVDAWFDTVRAEGLDPAQSLTYSP